MADFGFGFGDFAARERKQEVYKAFLLESDEATFREYSTTMFEALMSVTDVSAGALIACYLTARFNHFMKPGDCTVVNGRIYRVSVIETDRPEHSVTDCSTELCCDGKVLFPDSPIIRGAKNGVLYDTTHLERPKVGNSHGVRGPNPGEVVTIATHEELRIFLSEFHDVIVGLLTCVQNHLKNEAGQEVGV